MGQVYRATDTELGREVALKILPAAFADDPDRLARFQREAQVLASLNHPGIAAIYGIEKNEDTQALVLELVEGPTLADRIAQGPIPVDEALPIAKQIAEALEAAHEGGVIHRDLKPANIKVREDGTVKVLDFGLAKALDTTPQGDPSQSPTLTAAATQMGVIMGTAAYMSPEQARGKPVDKRADIWAFGCVLYEVLTGQRAFEGEDVSLTLSAVLQREPTWETLASSTPVAIRRLLRRCLAKDVKQRLRDIGEARVVLAEDVHTDIVEGSGAPSSTASGRLRLGPASIAGAVILIAAGAFFAGSSFPAPGPSTIRSPRHLALAAPVGVDLSYRIRPSLAISPDSRRIAYVGEIGGRTQIYVHDVAMPGAARGLTETLGADLPFFSPDGENIAFFQTSMIRKRGLGGGQRPIDVAPASTAPGGHWTRDDSILFLPAYGAPLRRAVADGTIETLIEPRGNEEYYYPQALPNGDRVLCTINDNPGYSVAVLSLSTGERTTLVEDAIYGRYVPTGHVLFVRGNQLHAVRFDVTTGAVGAPVLIARNVVTDQGEVFAEFAVADDGTLVYLEAEPAGRWLYRLRPDQEPERLNTEPLSADYLPLDVSPDGELLAFSSEDLEIWVYDLTRDQVDARLTTSSGYDWNPVWNPDSQRIVFSSTRSGPHEFWEVKADLSEAPRLVLAGEENKWPSGWLADGTLAFHQANALGGTDVMVLSPGDEATPTPFAKTAFNEADATFHPDGSWIAYVSDNTGQMEVYVRPYPRGNRNERISFGGGRYPKFSADGSAIFFSRGDVVMRAEVVDAATMAVAPAEEFVRGVDDMSWDILPDGSGVIALEQRPTPQLRLILGAAALFEPGEAR